MMRLLSAIIFLLWCSSTIGQNVDYTIYEWDEVKNADPDTVYALDLSKSKLDSLPGALFTFTNLKYLDLRKNKLTDLPHEFSQLGQLEELYMGKNKLTAFPVEICQFKKLRKLSLHTNEIESLPACVEYLVSLEELDLFNNPIRSLSEGLIELENLKWMDLRSIKFSPDFQDNWSEKLPNVKIEFDPPCDCMK